MKNSGQEPTTTPTPTPPGDFIVACMDCARVRLAPDAPFVDARPAPWLRVSHGLCLECFAVRKAELDALHATICAGRKEAA